MHESEERFLAALEAGTIPNTEFRHRDHLRATWLYVVRDGPAMAVELMERTIRRFAAHHGHGTKFHLTLTRVWVRLVAYHAAHHPARTFDEFIAHNEALLDKDVPLRFYSRDVLFSPPARERWVDPDIRALPA